ncbi:DNA-binding response regulator [Microbacterium sp. SORGH_AS_0888]|uniref:helix-turn-helix transcriptional regulator n=1 Tax=Microbacterium sp. SORGH_AS_0888 TaxID=3041791 RepID=UPI00277E8BB7|nr:DNA-binding response regulator [Microbacterium sp. SORGH_AS_0888]MDQ1130043.1 two-component system nitrate/nitrite response regulator NarL [Microbacterium sp. SORGH_AS_0888]
MESRGFGDPLTRVAIVDASVLQRHRARDVLVQRTGVQVVQLSPMLAQLGAWMAEVDALRRPQMVLLALPPRPLEPRALAALGALRGAGIVLVVLTGTTNGRDMRALVRTGVDGIVSVNESEDVLVSVVEAARRGVRTCSPRVRTALESMPPTPALSRQEAKLVALYGAGCTIGETAAQMGVKEDTARKYLNRVKAKYAAVGRPARSKREIAQIARSDGFLGLDGQTP